MPNLAFYSKCDTQSIGLWALLALGTIIYFWMCYFLWILRAYVELALWNPWFLCSILSLLLALTRTLPKESFYFEDLLSVFRYYWDYFRYNLSLEVEVPWLYKVLLVIWFYEYCLMNVAAGGQATRAAGNDFGNGI
jgi:hypothetical protein